MTLSFESRRMDCRSGSSAASFPRGRPWPRSDGPNSRPMPGSSLRPGQGCRSARARPSTNSPLPIVLRTASASMRRFLERAGRRFSRGVLSGNRASPRSAFLRSSPRRSIMAHRSGRRARARARWPSASTFGPSRAATAGRYSRLQARKGRSARSRKPASETAAALPRRSGSPATGWATPISG